VPRKELALGGEGKKAQFAARNTRILQLATEKCKAWKMGRNWIDSASPKRQGRLPNNRAKKGKKIKQFPGVGHQC